MNMSSAYSMVFSRCLNRDANKRAPFTGWFRTPPRVQTMLKYRIESGAYVTLILVTGRSSVGFIVANDEWQGEKIECGLLPTGKSKPSLSRIAAILGSSCAPGCNSLFVNP